jgi:RNA polymerase sigma factor (sigma-70 family)
VILLSEITCLPKLTVGPTGNNHQIPIRPTIVASNDSSVSVIQEMAAMTAPDVQHDDAHELRISLISQSFASGEDTGLKAAYVEYGSLVYSLCRRSVDDATATDITQEVFIAAWRNRHRFDPERGGLAPWLTGICRNKIIDHFRATGREDRRVDRVKDSRPATATELEDVTLRMLLVDAIDTLPPRARDMVSMAFFDDLTHV